MIPLLTQICYVPGQMNLYQNFPSYTRYNVYAKQPLLITAVNYEYIRVVRKCDMQLHVTVLHLYGPSIFMVPPSLWSLHLMVPPSLWSLHHYGPSISVVPPSLWSLHLMVPPSLWSLIFMVPPSLWSLHLYGPSISMVPPSLWSMVPSCCVVGMQRSMD